VNNEKRTSEPKADASPAVRCSLFDSRFLSAPFIFAIRLYQVTLGPLMGGHCRFHPTCSAYAIEAYSVHGPLRGTWLTVRRLVRCHPLCRGGLDPVPGRAEQKKLGVSEAPR
jgi:putative membrane protein insertion efficiency factor